MADRRMATTLTAQPSPAGQHSGWILPDDARIVGVIADSIERGKLDHPGFYRNTQLGEVLRRVLSAALSARQPVGEPAAWVHEEDPERVISARQKATALRDQGASGSSVRPYSVPAYLHAPPAQAVDLANVIDQIAQQWDGCNYDAVGETIDVGQAIRAAAGRLIDSQAVGK